MFSGNIDESCICPLCPLYEVGDELHYLYKCPFFVEERKKYIDYTSDQIDIFHAKTMFNSIDPTLLNKLANFVDLIMSIFYHREQWEYGIQN